MDDGADRGVTAVAGKPMSGVLRVVLVTMAGLMGAFCAFFTMIFTLGTLQVVPVWLYRSMDRPFMALVCTVAYMVAISVEALLTFAVFTLASRLIKKLVITRWHIVTCVVLLVMVMVLCYGVLPVFVDFVNL